MLSHTEIYDTLMNTTQNTTASGWLHGAEVVSRYTSTTLNSMQINSMKDQAGLAFIHLHNHCGIAATARAYKYTRRE